MIKKISISIFAIILTIVSSWCYNKNITNQINNNQSEVLENSWYLELKSENDILTWINISWSIISGLFYPIVILWNYINYSWSLSLYIPNAFKHREYYRSPNIINTTDTLHFYSNDEENFIIETTLINLWDNIKNICKQINNEWRRSIHEQDLTINGQDIKITKQIFIVSWQWIDSQESKQTNICFIKNNIVYDIRRFNYIINEDIILNSIVFY